MVSLGMRKLALAIFLLVSHPAFPIGQAKCDLYAEKPYRAVVEKVFAGTPFLNRARIAMEDTTCSSMLKVANVAMKGGFDATRLGPLIHFGLSEAKDPEAKNQAARLALIAGRVSPEIRAKIVHLSETLAGQSEVADMLEARVRLGFFENPDKIAAREFPPGYWGWAWRERFLLEAGHPKALEEAKKVLTGPLADDPYGFTQAMRILRHTVDNPSGRIAEPVRRQASELMGKAAKRDLKKFDESVPVQVAALTEPPAAFAGRISNKTQRYSYVSELSRSRLPELLTFAAGLLDKNDPDEATVQELTNAISSEAEEITPTMRATLVPTLRKLVEARTDQGGTPSKVDTAAMGLLMSVGGPAELKLIERAFEKDPATWEKTVPQLSRFAISDPEVVGRIIQRASGTMTAEDFGRILDWLPNLEHPAAQQVLNDRLRGSKDDKEIETLIKDWLQNRRDFSAGNLAALLHIQPPQGLDRGYQWGGARFVSDGMEKALRFIDDLKLPAKDSAEWAAMRKVALEALHEGALPAFLATRLLSRVPGSLPAEDVAKIQRQFVEDPLRPSQVPFVHGELFGLLVKNGLPEKDAIEIAKPWIDRLFDPNEAITQKDRVIFFESFRTRLPYAGKLALDAYYGSKLREQPHEKIANSCESLCAVARKHPIWLNKKYLDVEMYDTEANIGFATRALGLTALTAAARYCPDLAGALMTTWKEYKPKDKSPLAEVSPSTIYLKAAESLRQARNPAAGPGPIYSKMYMMLALGNLQRTGIDPKFSASLTTAYGDMGQSLFKDLEKFRDSKMQTYSGGSKMNNYLVVTAALASPELPKPLHDYLQEEARKVEKHATDLTAEHLCRVAYSAESSKPPSEVDATDAAGRASLLYLALFRHETDLAQKKKWLGRFAMCADLYGKVSATLADHLRKRDTHVKNSEPTISTERAPYYFMPVIPFVMEGLRSAEAHADWLKENPELHLPGNQINTAETRRELKESLALTMKKNGVFTESDPSTYLPSTSYNNSLGLLTLASDCAFEKNDRDFTVFRGEKQLNGSWNSRPTGGTHGVAQ